MLDDIERAPPRGLLIRSGKPSGFIAGADINEFTAFASEADALAADPARPGAVRPHRGAALPHAGAAAGLRAGRRHGAGAGLPLSRGRGRRQARAWACPRCSWASIPGFGGTVRSRAAAGRAAGDGHDAHRQEHPRRQGAEDRPGRCAGARGRAAERVARAMLLRRPPRRTGRAWRERAAVLAAGARLRRAGARAQVARRVRREHYPAPYAIVDLWARHGARGRAAYEAEARSIARLFHDDTARNLVRVFLLQDRLKALGGKAAARVRDPARARGGRGLMGGDIAAWCALRGLTVSLQDRELKFVRTGAEACRASCSPSACQRPGRTRRGDGAPGGRCGGRARARSRPGDRGDLREPGAKRALYATLRAAHEARRAAGHQHLEPRARGAGAEDWPIPAASSACTSSIRWRRCRWWKSSSAQPRGAEAHGRGAPASCAGSTSCPCPAAARRASSSTAC